MTDRFRATVPFFSVLTIQWFNDGGLIIIIIIII